MFPRMVKATVLLSQSGSPSSARRGEGAEEQALAVLVLGGSRKFHSPGVPNSSVLVKKDFNV